MGDGQIVKQGNDIPTSYDNFILHDLEQSIVFENKTLDDHYDYVMSRSGNSYKGANKFAYGRIVVILGIDSSSPIIIFILKRLLCLKLKK